MTSVNTFQNSIERGLGNPLSNKRLFPRADYAQYMYYTGRLAAVAADFSKVTRRAPPNPHRLGRGNQRSLLGALFFFGTWQARTLFTESFYALPASCFRNRRYGPRPLNNSQPHAPRASNTNLRA